MTIPAQHAVGAKAPGQIVNPVPGAIYHKDTAPIVSNCAMDNHKRAYRAAVEAQLRLDAHDATFGR